MTGAWGIPCAGFFVGSRGISADDFRVPSRLPNQRPTDSHPRARARLLTTLLVLLPACRVYPGSQAPVTPQRPTFSADTRTASPGTLEQETGFTIDPGDRFFTPTTLRYGSGPATEVFLGFSPFNYVSNPTTPSEVGFGDIVFGVRHRLRDEGPRSAWAVQSTTKLPTASDAKGLGTGELDALFAAINSTAFGDLAVTAYYELGILGNSGSGVDLGYSVALAGDYPLNEQFSAFAEVAATIIPEQDDTQLFTILGAAFHHSPSLSLDVSILVGVDDAPDFGILIGVTQNIGQPLW